MSARACGCWKKTDDPNHGVYCAEHAPKSSPLPTPPPVTHEEARMLADMLTAEDYWREHGLRFARYITAAEATEKRCERLAGFVRDGAKIAAEQAGEIAEMREAAAATAKRLAEVEVKRDVLAQKVARQSQSLGNAAAEIWAMSKRRGKLEAVAVAAKSHPQPSQALRDALRALDGGG